MIFTLTVILLKTVIVYQILVMCPLKDLSYKVLIIIIISYLIIYYIGSKVLTLLEHCQVSIGAACHSNITTR